jgi:hypothetical protein
MRDNQGAPPYLNVMTIEQLFSLLDGGSVVREFKVFRRLPDMVSPLVPVEPIRWHDALRRSMG